MLAQCANGLGNNSNEACRRITNGGPLVSPYSCFTQYFIRCSLHVQLLHCVDNEVNAAVLFLRSFVARHYKSPPHYVPHGNSFGMSIGFL